MLCALAGINAKFNNLRKKKRMYITMILSKFLVLILHTYTSQLYKHAHCQLFWFPSFWLFDVQLLSLVIPTLNHYFDIISDIPSGSIYGIVSIVILTFYLASVLTYFLAYTLTFLLTFYLAFILTYFEYFVAYIMTFFLAFYLASILTF